MRSPKHRRGAAVLVVGGSIFALGGAQALGVSYSPPTYSPPTYSPPSSPAPSKSKKKKPANKVTIKGSGGSYSFSPKSLKVKKGAKVRWSWKSDAQHNVTFSSGHSKTGKSGSYSKSFPKSGSYSYHCTIHGFTGKIVVK